jgi:predicted DNA-binding antitoxin AbrB/MazE fold protein
MTTTVEAIYENGTLKLSSPLPLEEKAHVVVTIQTKADDGADDERAAWLKQSEETLTKAWDNPGDDLLVPREALRELQAKGRLTTEQAESYLREVTAERLANDSQRPE